MSLIYLLEAGRRQPLSFTSLITSLQCVWQHLEGSCPHGTQRQDPNSFFKAMLNK